MARVLAARRPQMALSAARAHLDRMATAHVPLPEMTPNGSGIRGYRYRASEFAAGGVTLRAAR